MVKVPSQWERPQLEEGRQDLCVLMSMVCFVPEAHFLNSGEETEDSLPAPLSGQLSEWFWEGQEDPSAGRRPV